MNSSLSEGDTSQFAKGSGEDLKIDTAFVIEETRNAMISFNREIKEYYEEGMTYSQLKYALDPDNSLNNITTEGDELLFEAYTNITNDVSEGDMSGLKMTKSLEFILKKTINDGFTDVKDVDFESGSRVLFGLDSNYGTTAKGGGCKWYQIGCHLSSLWNWLAADANGAEPGSTTNGQVLTGILGTVSSIIAIYGALF